MNERTVGLPEIMRVFLKIGAMSYGGPAIAVRGSGDKSAVGWISHCWQTIARWIRRGRRTHKISDEMWAEMMSAWWSE